MILWKKNEKKFLDRDTRIKIGLHNHGNMLLLLMGVEDEVKEIEDIDMDALEGKNVKENFRAKLKSGRILDVKSGIVRLI